MRPQSRRPNHTSAPAPIRRASPELPTSGYTLVVDGHMKAQFETREGARKGAEDLKRRFPMLQIRVYDAEAKRSDDIVLAT
jgi:hypothetical protein